MSTISVVLRPGARLTLPGRWGKMTKVGGSFALGPGLTLEWTNGGARGEAHKTRMQAELPSAVFLDPMRHLRQPGDRDRSDTEEIWQNGIYVETTVIGHIAGRQQSDIIVAAANLLHLHGGAIDTNMICSFRR